VTSRPVAASDWLRSPAAAMAAKFRSTLLSDAAFLADRAKLRHNTLTEGSTRNPSIKQNKSHTSQFTDKP